MSVFRNLMAVGVSGAIVFFNLGQATAVPSPVESSEGAPNQNSTQLQGFKENPQKSNGTASVTSEQSQAPVSLTQAATEEITAPLRLETTFKQEPAQSKQTVSSIQEAPVSDQPASVTEPLTLTSKQNSRKTQPTDAVTKSSVLQQPSNPTAIATTFKQNPTKPQPSASTSSLTTVTNSSAVEPQQTQQPPSTVETNAASVATTPTNRPNSPEADPFNVLPRFNVPDPVSGNPLPPEVNQPLQVQAGLSQPQGEAATLTNSLPVQDSRRSQAPLFAQEVTQPALQIPDLDAPTNPYPSGPVPNGTLQTNPPEILLPSPNQLYVPTTTNQVLIEETIPITLDQAVDLAVRNNENIRIAQLQVEQSLATLREAQSSLYPNLIYRSSFGRSVSASQDLSVRAANRRIRVARFNQDPGAAETPFQTRFGTYTFDNSIQFQYDFGINGQRRASIRANEELLRISELRLETTLEDLRFQVTRAYYDLQQSDAAVDIQSAAVRNSQRSLQDAEALERAGVGTRFEVLQARVTLANAQQDLTNSRRDQLRSRRELAAILNIDENTNLLAADQIALAGAWDLTLEETIVQAYRNRSELAEQLAERDRAQQLRKAALGSTRPNVSFAASYNVLGLINDDPDYTATRGWADGYDAQVQFSWNFFDGGAAKSRARQRELDIGIAEERFDQLLNQIRLEVERGYFDLQANFDNIQTARLGVEEATEALRLARLRFQAGVGTQLEVINQETDLTRAQNRLLNAIIGYNRALSDLQRAVSNLPGNVLSDYPLE